MTGHVERWRRAGAWRSRFPDHLVDRNKRIDWLFWFDENGKPAEGVTTLPDGDRGQNFVAFHLPHRVTYPNMEEHPLPLEWLREHLSGVWQYWGAKQDAEIFFEFPEDAVYFKLVHYGV